MIIQKGLETQTPSLLILDLLTLTPPLIPISKLTCSVLQAFLAFNNTIHALLIHTCMLILAPKLFYITLQDGKQFPRYQKVG